MRQEFSPALEVRTPQRLVFPVTRSLSLRRPMPMSATAQAESDNGKTLKLNEEDLALKIVRNRLDAKKTVTLHVQQKDIAKQLSVLALQHELSAERVIIFVHSPETAGKVVRELKQAGHIGIERIELLTGTIRGYERDRLITTPVLAHLLAEGKPSQTEYLVSTSAGEVGADFELRALS